MALNKREWDIKLIRHLAGLSELIIGKNYMNSKLRRWTGSDLYFQNWVSKRDLRRVHTSSYNIHLCWKDSTLQNLQAPEVIPRNRRVTIEIVASYLDINHGSVHEIIYEHAIYVSRELTENHNRNRFEIFKSRLDGYLFKDDEYFKRYSHSRGNFGQSL